MQVNSPEAPITDPSSVPPPPEQPPGGHRTNLRGLAVSLIINAVCPYLIYAALKHWTHVSEMTALVATGIPSLLDGAFGIIKRRRIDFMAGMTLFSIAISLGLIALGGSPRLYLVRESLFTASYGLAMLISLLFPKPLGFYTGRYFVTGNDPAREAWFDAAWDYGKGFRRLIWLQTVIWGVGTVLEAVVRGYLAFTLPVARFLIVSPLVFYGYMGLTLLVSTVCTRRWKKTNAGPQMGQAHS